MRDVLTLSSGVYSLDLFDLATGRAVALTGAQGWGFPTVTGQWSEGAGPGGVFRGQREGFRDLAIPLLLDGLTQDAIQETLSLLSLILHPRTGAARLTYGTKAGDTWWLDVVRAQGGDWTWGDNGDALILILTLRAGDPFWTRTRPEVFRIEQAEPHCLLAPSSLAELMLTRSTAFGVQQVNNPGTVDAWPTWRCAGPLARLALTGPGGETISWEGGLDAGETLLIETKPPTVTVDGANRYQDLAPAPWFWPIPPGPSDVSVEADGVTAQTQIECVWRPRTEVLV